MNGHDDGFMRWWNRHTLVTSASFCLYFVPAILVFFGGWLYVVAGVLVIFGLWKSRPSRRWIAGFSILCFFWPNPWVKVLGWAAGFYLTIFLDGAYKRSPQPPSSEWD